MHACEGRKWGIPGLKAEAEKARGLNLTDGQGGEGPCIKGRKRQALECQQRTREEAGMKGLLTSCKKGEGLHQGTWLLL